MRFDKELIIALILDNALKHGGKASSKAVLGKLISIKPEYKFSINDLVKTIEQLTNYVNNLTFDEIKLEYERYKHLIPEKKIVKEKHILPPLPNAEYKKVVTRFAPNPDFVLHLGSLRPLVISHEYARMYEGKFILRFEDTDPRTKKPKIEYYQQILDDIEWLGIKPDEIYYQSDRLDIYYKVARELIERGKAYVCTCNSRVFAEYAKRSIACPHREQSIEKNLDLFEKMLNGYFQEGEAVLRVKTDLKHPNPSVRDWVALRIIDVDKYPHPRVGDKYTVWPLYNFSCAIDDYYMGITHVFRGVEHKINEEKQRYIYAFLGWREPIYIHHGRLAVPGGILSKSRILQGIKMGIYKGIDDPRLLTIAALRRRGFQPETLKRIILKVGISPSNAVIDFTLLASENKKIIDKQANRFFGVRSPFKLVIPYRDEISDVKIRLHPDYPERGYRRFKMESPYTRMYIDFEDKQYILSGNIFRLIGLGNYRIKESKLNSDEYIAEFIDNDLKKAIKEKYRFIHWVPIRHAVESSFIYPETEFKGYIENNILREKTNNVVQLERLGYFRIEEKGLNSVKVVFGHN